MTFSFPAPRLFLLAVLTACLSACASTQTQTQASGYDRPMPAFTNIGDAKLYMKHYIASGQYDADVAALDAKAEAYVIAEAHRVRRPALVLDIDETSLSNLPEIKADDFGFIKNGECRLPEGPCGHRAWQKMAASPGIGPTLSVFRAAKANGVTVFFITGRDELERQATILNLHRAGYRGWQGLILRPAGTTTPSAADYKAPQRARIEAMGYTIIANIGDQPSDLAGGHSLKTFQVPNPFYRIH
jgi:predicted secreted acid phosphatase